MLVYIFKTYNCPICGTEAKKHSTKTRTLQTLSGRLKVKVSLHYCYECKKHFQVPLPLQIAGKRSHYANDVREKVLNFEGTLQQVEMYMKNNYGIRIPPTTIHDWKAAHTNQKEKTGS